MSKVLVTGSTGALGKATIEFLLSRQSAKDVVALARDPAKATELQSLGVEVRQGDYFDKQSLEKAFQGIEKLLLVSTTAFTDRETQHFNVIDAAKSAGVQHIVYTSIQRKPGSDFIIPMVTESDKATEQAIIESGIKYTILRNGLYLDVLPYMLGKTVLTTGVRVPGGSGTSPIVLRSDLAEATAVVLSEIGHENKIYTLGASKAFSFADVAKALSEISGHEVPYVDVSAETFIAERVADGFPETAATFLSEWVEVVANGELGEVTHDLDRILGRETAPFSDFLKAAYAG